MRTPPHDISLDEARRTVDEIEKALKEGYLPLDRRPCKGERSALSVAAERMGLGRSTVACRIIVGGCIERVHGLRVNWKLYKAVEKSSVEQSKEPPAEPIEIRRLRDRFARAASAQAEAERRAIAAEGLREAIFRLAKTPLDPPSWNPRRSSEKEKVGEAIILTISDVHMGETINLAELGGRNSYNQEIGRKRLERLFQTVVKLDTEHWTGPPPSVIYVLLLGDQVSGEIHEELERTNDLLAIPAVRIFSECIVAGLELLAKTFPKIPINVVSVPGNHGRVTRKPQAKSFAVNSYDTLAAWVIESWFAAKGDKRFTFSAPASGDALINIHGWNILVSHGDRIGSRGGAGFVGPAATIARGFQKLVMDYAAEGISIDLIIIGHFHSSMELSQGFANGCVCGPSEFSRTNRMRSEPASQWMLTIHPKYLVSRRWKILLGVESEGSIYKGRA